MSKWEYTELFVGNGGGFDELQRLGQKGWELISVDNEMAWLKRLLPPTIVDKGEK